jgi:hypothetical protein
MRLSQAQFADVIRAAGNAMGVPNRCTKRLVQKWETGEHAACSPDYLRVLQAVTGLSVRELGFQNMPDGSGKANAPSDGNASEDIDATNSLNADGGAAVLAHATLGTRSPLSVDELAESAIDRLRHALNHPSSVDWRTAELVETATANLFDLEHHCPARLLAPSVDRHLSTVTALLTAARHEGVRRKLTVSAGRAALLAGWLAFDRGDIASSHRLWEAASSAAQGTADTRLFAAGLTYQSYSAARRGDPGSAWQLAHTAASHTPEDPRATTWATARVALYAAQLGEHEAADAARTRALALGEHLAQQTPSSESQPWTRSFSHATLLATTAHTAALLKDPNAADYAVKAVDELGPAQVKARAVVLAEAALTAAIVGEFELCNNYGSLAATLTRELEVSVAADLLHEVVPLLLPYSDTRPVRELLPQVTRLTRTADMEDGA